MPDDVSESATPSRVDVEVSDTQAHLAIDKVWVARLVRQTLDLEGISVASISIAFVDDASIRVINARHLSHDWATDVISFRFSEEDDQELTGELIVSAEMAVNMALEVKCDPLNELALYLVHGLLHLCGYDDESDEEVAAIRDREAGALAAFAVENPVWRVGLLPVMSDDSGRESAPWPR